MLLIQNAKAVYTMEADTPLPNADILIENGKIKAVGKNLSALGAEVLDAAGLTATPGLVDAHTHQGGFGLPDMNNQDMNEMSGPLTPEVEAFYGVDPFDANLRHSAACGVTSICITPGSANVIGGWAFATKTTGTDIRKMCIKNPCALKLALGGNPKRYHGGKKIAPMTRMGIAAMIKKTFYEAKEYMEKLEAAGDDADKKPPYNDKYEAIVPVLKKEIPIKVHCEQFDMLTTIEIAREFGIDYTLEHAWLSEAFYNELIEGGGHVCYGPAGNAIGYGELVGASSYEVMELDKRGVPVSVITDAPIYTADALIFQAGEAVRFGMDPVRALRAITLTPACALGIDDRVGSLAVGKDADVVLFDGMPLTEVAAQPVVTLQDGKIVYERS